MKYCISSAITRTQTPDSSEEKNNIYIYTCVPTLGARSCHTVALNRDIKQFSLCHRGRVFQCGAPDTQSSKEDIRKKRTFAVHFQLFQLEGYLLDARRPVQCAVGDRDRPDRRDPPQDSSRPPADASPVLAGQPPPVSRCPCNAGQIRDEGCGSRAPFHMLMKQRYQRQRPEKVPQNH